MKLLISILAGAAIWRAYGQGTFEAVEDYDSATATLWDGTAGGAFQVTNTIAVTALGCFTNVFTQNEGTIEVGLWDASGDLLASSTLAATNMLVNQSRYESINPVFLSPNQTYLLGAYSTNGTIVLDGVFPTAGGSIVTAPEVELEYLARFSGAFAAPMAQTNYPGAFYLGPNFEFQSGVPEPSSGLLLSLAGLLFLARRKWRSCARNAA